jgi:hypothetical protein
VRSRHGEYLSASRDGENHFTPPDHPPYLATTTAIPKEPIMDEQRQPKKFLDVMRDTLRRRN